MAHTSIISQGRAAITDGNPPYSTVASSACCCQVRARLSGMALRRLAGNTVSAILLRPEPLSACCWPAQAAVAARDMSSGRSLSPAASKKAAKRDKKARKAEDRDVKGAGAANSDGTGAFSDEGGPALEPDMTRLVLTAIANVTPQLDVRQVRTATKITYVPGLMAPRRARSLALHWLVRAADARAAAAATSSFAECLALELLLAYQKRGAARQKRDDLHKLALQNRANVHLRWW
jgi:small subunit ribosomal protein S7